jgi:hypothetical protein
MGCLDMQADLTLVLRVVADVIDFVHCLSGLADGQQQGQQ